MIENKSQRWLVAVSAGLAWCCFAHVVHAQTARCSIPGVGYIATNTLAQCARIAQASPGGRGVWGGHSISMAYGNLVVDGRPAGRVRNPSGTYGSLTQRCTAGDTQACAQYQRQANRAEQQYEQMMRSRHLGEY